MTINGEIVLYQPEGEVRLEVRMEKESVWLSQMQMPDLFQKDRTVIGRHIKNIYKEGELAKDITCANFAHVGADADQTYNTTLYNLDVIISVGYRVKSIAGTRFRQWANHVLKDYMLKGYAVNQRKIATDLQIADRLHEQVKRNIERFPEDFCFQLNRDEIEFVKSQIATSRMEGFFSGQKGGGRNWRCGRIVGHD